MLFEKMPLPLLLQHGCSSLHKIPGLYWYKNAIQQKCFDKKSQQQQHSFTLKSVD